MPSRLLYVRFGNGGFINRLGGSALAQCLKQVGDNASDVDDFERFVKAFDIVQALVKGGYFFNIVFIFSLLLINAGYNDHEIFRGSHFIWSRCK